MGFFSEIFRVQLFMVTRHIINTSAKKFCHFDQNLLRSSTLNAGTQQFGRKWTFLGNLSTRMSLNRCLNTIDRPYALDMTPIDPFQQFLFFEPTYGPSFRAGRGTKIGKIVKNGGSRSIN